MTTEQFTTLVDIMILWDTETGAPFPFPNETLNHLRAIRQAADHNNVDTLLRALHNRLDGDLIRIYAAASLMRCLQRASSTLTATQHKTIADSLGNVLKTETNQACQLAVIRALQYTQHPDALEVLIVMLCRSQEAGSRPALAAAIRAFSYNNISWRQKFDKLVTALYESGLWRVHLDAAMLITACLPTITSTNTDAIAQEQLALSNAIMEHGVWHHDDERMTSILAALLTENCGRNLNRANQLIQSYETNHQTPAAQLDPLRLEINATVTPAELHTTLENRFYKPLTKKQEDVNNLWHGTVKRMQVALWARLYLAVGLQTVGVVFFLVSTAILLSQGVEPQYLIGMAVGLGSVVFSFLFPRPISAARDTLRDIGIANAAYLAFVQRTLHISTGYAQQYLQNRLTTPDIEASSKLIQEALESTVNAMNPTEFSIEEFISRV